MANFSNSAALRNSIKERLAEVLSIDSVSGKERELGNYLVRYMKEVGLRVETEAIAPGRFNVYGHTRKSHAKPNLMLNGHYDVVNEGCGWTRPAFGGKIEGDKIYGRGAVDMKGGLVAMIEAAALIAQNDKKQHDDVVVAAVVDEEENQAGTKKIVQSGKVVPHLAIVGEPTRLKVVRAHKGEIVFEIQVTGRSAHSSVPEEGINSIYHSARIIRELEHYGKFLKKRRHPLLGPGTISVNMISGGTSLATVPEKTTLIVDARTLPEQHPSEVLGQINDIISNLKRREIANLRAYVRTLITAFPLETDEDHQLVQVALDASSSVLGYRSFSTGAPYATDGWILSNAGVPTIVLGPGDVGRAHGPDEWVSISEVSRASQIYSEIATRIA
jgi:succinyl-diaminopimelate desuccinylase